MRKAVYGVIFLGFFLFIHHLVKAQHAKSHAAQDSVNIVLLEKINQLLLQDDVQQIEDSLHRSKLMEELQAVKKSNAPRRLELEKEVAAWDIKIKQQEQLVRFRLDSIRRLAIGYPVLGIVKDTLFFLYAKLGEATPADRAKRITQKIKDLYDLPSEKMDSLTIVPTDFTFDIMAGEQIIMSISETDAKWHSGHMLGTATFYRDKIAQSLREGKDTFALWRRIMRLALGLGLLTACFFSIKLLGRLRNSFLNLLERKKDIWLKGWNIGGYTFMEYEQATKVARVFTGAMRWFLIFVLIYITLRVGFSISPYTRGWAERPFKLVLNPFREIFHAIWHYLPNLFTILAIYLVVRYTIKFIRYIFNEIQCERLKIPGFYPDWAMPTFSMIRFLLYAFMFVLIFPYLPGSDSTIFKSVSVFLGLLISLGSSSAISNIIAGLVITYMRPFKIGDRIRVDNVTGDVVEKTLLVTRLKSNKNEIITLPNALILSKNTLNFSTEAPGRGLIVHTTVTIGYNTPWKDIESALITAALRTEYILSEPPPYVLQTALNDSYVAYEINAFTREPTRQAHIYSDLHRNIQDACNEKGIEIMSPTYLATRDGNAITIPANYLEK